MKTKVKVINILYLSSLKFKIYSIQMHLKCNSFFLNKEYLFLGIKNINKKQKDINFYHKELNLVNRSNNSN